MESKSGQNQNTYQQQNKTRWQIRGEEAVKDEKNLLFEGLIADPNYLFWILNNTVNYCQHVHDEAKKLGIELLPCPSSEQREKLGITFGKCCYNKLLTLSDNKQVLGCQIISAHLIKQLTSNFFANALLEHDFALGGKVKEAHASVLVPCTNGKLYVLNVFKYTNSDKFFSTIHELLTYADDQMAYELCTKCGENRSSVGLYIRVLLNQIINKYKNLFPDIVKPLIKTVDEIDQKGDLLLQPYIVSLKVNHKEFDCRPQDKFSNGTPYVHILFSLISDDDKIGDYSKYDMNVWNAANNISVLVEKSDWENFLKLAEAFPQSKILIACPNVFSPKPGDPVIKLDIKGREAIKNLKADGKVFQKVLSLKEFLDIESKYYPELKKILKSRKFKREAQKYINDFDKEQEEQRMQRHDKLLKDLENLYNKQKA